MMKNTIFVIFFLAFPASTLSKKKEPDLLSLQAFKSAIDADPQGALSSWNHTIHFCRWDGIQCGGAQHPNRVVAIDLTSQGLVGPLSPYIGNLSFLRTIVLLNNSFHGPIPTEVFHLRRLEVLDLQKNSFTGSIPANLSDWRNLAILDLVHNKLTGNIPAQLGDFMQKLELLDMAFNQLSGRIPPSIGNLSSLIGLSFVECGLTGEIPESLAQLRNLEILQLSKNSLTGTIPSAIFNISSLSRFYVPMNHLHGVLPSTIGLTLPQLVQLHLYENHFTGPIPVSISNASLLENVAFNNNNFTGSVPRVEELTNLQRFSFGANLIEDDVATLIPSFANSTNLVYLDGYENLLTGSLPESIANLSTQLQSLLFWVNKIHGEIPSSIGDLTGLTRIIFDQNYLEGSIPVSIGKLSNVHHLYFPQNRLTNEMPSSLGNMTAMVDLSFSGNSLSGNIPSNLANFSELLSLDLSYNNFSGLIPEEIITLSSISIMFNLSHNAFDGPIPREVGSLTNLGTLDLSYNRLSGIIPNSLSKCTSLQQLHLEGNLLEGEIPQGMSALMGLQDLDLSKNNLTGPIPSFLGKLNLSKLNLSFNSLHGEVPIEGVFKNISLASLDGNDHLCGGISELKLTPCSSPSKPHRKNLSSLLKILIPVLGVGGICLLFLAFFTYKKRVSRKSVAPTSFTGTHFMRLSYADLLKATGGFAETNLLGAGRFGSVYKGILDDDGETHVAVKVLNLFVRGASKSFMAECNALRDVRHRNLLSILTVCESIDFQGNDFKALVYEFKANGSLEKWLYHSHEQEGKQNAQTHNLTMMQRLNVVVDIAQAIEYLHFGTESSIVHGDLKPSNILLDHEMTACVGDFGLAKIVSDIVPSHENYSSIGIRGTIGYVPPEYGTCDPVSIQGDVYSYGILLMEIFTDIRPTDNMFNDNLNLHNFVSATLPDRVQEIVDPQIRADMNNDKMKNCMTSILGIGVSCSKELPRDRMSMTNVVNELCKIQRWLCS